MTLILSGSDGVSDIDGSAATPAIRGTDANTGIFFPAADTVSIATGGVERVRTNADGNVGVGITPNTWGLPVSKALQVGNASLSNYNGETNCYLTGNAYYNSGFKYIVTKAAARYDFEGLNHTWYSAPSGTSGTDITFTQVMAVSKDKSLALQGASTQTGTGITFPATQSASSDANTLDDYEEGTWTPTITAATPPTGVAYNFQGGRYRKIGSLVVAWFGVNINSVGTGGSGELRISGLPFVSSASGPYQEPTATIQGGRWISSALSGQTYCFPLDNTTVLGTRYMNNADTVLSYGEIQGGSAGVGTYLNAVVIYRST